MEGILLKDGRVFKNGFSFKEVRRDSRHVVVEISSGGYHPSYVYVTLGNFSNLYDWVVDNY